MPGLVQQVNAYRYHQIAGVTLVQYFGYRSGRAPIPTLVQCLFTDDAKLKIDVLSSNDGCASLSREFIGNLQRKIALYEDFARHRYGHHPSAEIAIVAIPGGSRYSTTKWHISQRSDPIRLTLVTSVPASGSEQETLATAWVALMSHEISHGLNIAAPGRFGTLVDDEAEAHFTEMCTRVIVDEKWLSFEVPGADGPKGASTAPTFVGAELAQDIFWNAYGERVTRIKDATSRQRGIDVCNSMPFPIVGFAMK